MRDKAPSELEKGFTHSNLWKDHVHQEAMDLLNTPSPKSPQFAGETKEYNANNESANKHLPSLTINEDH